MRIHVLQHVPFEDPGSLVPLIQQQGHELTTTHWYNHETAPAVSDVDIIIVMGGPMGVYDDEQYPWLAEEKTFIAAAIAAGKKILGICLGAQLIACVMGARVSRNPHREIGWFPLNINPNAKDHPIAAILADCKNVFHWHGDTFALPESAIHIAISDACANQAFCVGEQIIGFQFHLETTPASAQALITHCGDELDGSRYVQSAETILQTTENFAQINRAMQKIWLTFIGN